MKSTRVSAFIFHKSERDFRKARELLSICNAGVTYSKNHQSIKDLIIPILSRSLSVLIPIMMSEITEILRRDPDIRVSRNTVDLVIEKMMIEGLVQCVNPNYARGKRYMLSDK